MREIPTLKCDKLSASRVNVFEQCSFLYYVRYHLGIRDEKTNALNIGTVVHSVFEHIGRHYDDCVKGDSTGYKIIGWEPVLEKILKASKKEGSIKSQDYDTVRSQCYSIIEGYIESEKCILYKKPMEINGKPAVEIEFNMKLCGVAPVRGFIDSMYMLDNGTILVNDFKTSKSKKSYLEMMNDIQMKIYYVVAKKITGVRNIIMRLDYCRLKDEKLTTFNDSQDIEGEIVSIFNKINNYRLQDVSRSPSWKCDRMCMGHDACMSLWDCVVKSGIL